VHFVRGGVVNLSDTAKMRRPEFGGANAGVTGRVGHDDRGNAVWEWAREPDAIPLESTGLAIIEDEAPLPLATVKINVNKVAAKSGYNPYESGLIEKKNVVAKKRDLRELSRWIELKKMRGEDTKG
jgi:hypothetical protein